MFAWIVAYLATAASLLMLDSAWLSLTASRLYRAHLGSLLRTDFALIPAAGFYLIYIGGILIFAIGPALQSGRWMSALARGAMLGFVAYATYDLTNQATMKGWSSVVTIADLCWGTVLTGTAATMGFFVARWTIQRF